MQVALQPTGRSLHDAFDTALSALGPFEPNPHLAVALSGGSDSMGLALLTEHYVQTYGGRLTTLTVDHGLRPESKDEAAHVARRMRERAIAHVTLTPLHAHTSNNLMEAARTWRYDALADWCRAHAVLHCLIAHHAADQRETIALHTARGETEDGPSGMRSVRNYRGVRFLRPLLGFEKETLQDFLRREDATWVEDPTNRNERFARARLRKRTFGDALDSDRAARECTVAHAAMRCVTIDPAGFATLDRDAWRRLPPPIATQLLADTVRTVGYATSRPRKHKTLQLAGSLRAMPAVKRTLGGCRITAAGNRVMIEPEKQPVALPFVPPKPLAASPFW